MSALSAPRPARIPAFTLALLGAFGLVACDKPAPSGAGAAEPAAAAAPAADPGLAVPAGARVFFVAPADGATFEVPAGAEKAKIHVTFGIEGMTVRAAGEVVPGTGHHHIIVNGPGTERGAAVPANESHIHYGKGQTEADLELGPGAYTLTMQFANGQHLSYGEQMRAKVAIKVKAADPTAAGASSAKEAAAGADAGAAGAAPGAVAPATDDPAPVAPAGAAPAGQ
jgi:hypothetical protein